MNLVIVESPTKAKTISRFLGKDYTVLASLGHVRDLPPSRLGVDVEKDFEPEYEISTKAKKTVAEIKKAAATADSLILATDPDREGEAIAWHIANVVGQNKRSKLTVSRVVFHEITESAVKDAFSHARELDLNLVDAQQARRILDRLVGYLLSPLLWRKIRYGLSAGRVQSVAVRLIVKREDERRAFKAEEYWKIKVDLEATAEKGLVTVELTECQGKKAVINNGEKANQISENLKTADYTVAEINREERKRYPSPPFMTSTLQRAAGTILGFPAKRTMRAAQNLYEEGLITYHRTDSLNLAESALTAFRGEILKTYGPEYLPEKAIHYKTKAKVAQEAHEAIRPTEAGRREVGKGLRTDEARLYDLIWKRMTASQMNPAVFDETRIIVRAQVKNRPEKSYGLQVKGSIVKFPGFRKVYEVLGEEGEPGEAENEVRLPALTIGDNLKFIEVHPSQHFTEPPDRYSEATLIKALEENGIGRPSTYAPIISTIQERQYIVKDGKFLKPEVTGEVVDKLLRENFPEIVDVAFTAHLEENLDAIANGEEKWVPVVREFYKPFAEKLAVKEKEIKKSDYTTLRETEEKCPQCGRKLLVKLGKFGEFLSCPGFPDCKYAEPLKNKGAGGENTAAAVDAEQLAYGCPEDGGELILKESRFGKFIACKNYPKCKFTKNYLDKIGVKCPQCKEGEVITKKGRRGASFFGCSNYPKCKWAAWVKPTAVPAVSSPVISTPTLGS